MTQPQPHRLLCSTGFRSGGNAIVLRGLTRPRRVGLAGLCILKGHDA